MSDIQVVRRLGDLTGEYPEIERILRVQVKLLGVPHSVGGKIKKVDIIRGLPVLLTDSAHKLQQISKKVILASPVVLRCYPEEEKREDAHPILSAWIFVNVLDRVCSLVFDYSPLGVVYQRLNDHVRQLVNELYREVLGAALEQGPKIFSFVSVGVSRMVFEIVEGKVRMRSFVGGEYEDTSQLVAVSQGEMSIWKTNLNKSDLGLKWEIVDPGA